MVDAPLVAPSDVEGFPGAPFSAGVLAAAAGQVRSECGWHVAPVVSETVTVEAGGSLALLPSLRVVSVEAVRDEAGNVLTGWRFRPNGILKRAGGFPEVIEVDFTHGFDACPPELVGVIADRAQRVKAGQIRQESLGARSVSYAASSDGSLSDAVSRHALQGRL